MFEIAKFYMQCTELRILCTAEKELTVTVERNTCHRIGIFAY
jgi:hypothetical protein